MTLCFDINSDNYLENYLIYENLLYIMNEIAIKSFEQLHGVRYVKHPLRFVTFNTKNRDL